MNHSQPNHHLIWSGLVAKAKQACVWLVLDYLGKIYCCWKGCWWTSTWWSSLSSNSAMQWWRCSLFEEALNRGPELLWTFKITREGGSLVTRLNSQPGSFNQPANPDWIGYATYPPLFKQICGANSGAKWLPCITKVGDIAGCEKRFPQMPVNNFERQ